MSENNHLEMLQIKYREVFLSEEGAAVLEDLQARFNINNTTFERGDPHFSAFLEGQRSVVLTIMRMIDDRKQTQQEE
jgi:hypothetical protein|tara:strand:- start:997 stop:1227 length:231 start_codon:yes stop_codon:yes gene_type:complete